MNPEQIYEIPKTNYISSYVIGKSLVDTAVASHSKYWSVIKACQRHLMGEKPNKPEELKKKGMDWADNFNFNKGKAKIDKGVTESCARISDALSLCYVTFRDSKESDSEALAFLNNSDVRGVVASAIGISFVQALMQEHRLSSWLQRAEYPSYAFGYSVAVYEQGDWMPEIVHPLHIAFKPHTMEDDIQTWVTFQELDARELYDRWVTAKNKSITSKLNVKDSSVERVAADGWNLTGLEEVLVRAFKGRITNQEAAISTWDQVLPSCRDNPSWVMENIEAVKIAKIFTRELDGTLSEVYIPYDNTWINDVDKLGPNIIGGSLDTTAVDLRLFIKNHGKYVQSKHIQLIRDSGFTETGYIQDMRGIAAFTVEDSIRYNRHRNSMGNKMKFNGSPMFTASNTVSADRFKVTVSQGFSILPTGFDLVERQPNYDIAGHVAMLRFEEGEYTRDTQQFDAGMQGRLSSRPNKDEVRAASAEVAMAKAAKNDIKFRDYANLFYEVIKRMGMSFTEKDKGKLGKDRFVALALKNLKGVISTESELKEILEAIDSFSLAPVISDIETITIAIQMAETPFARNRFKRMMLVAKGLPIEEVNASVPLITDKMQDMDDVRIAQFENDSFWNGNEVVIQGKDDHIVHLDIHMQKGGNILRGVNEQRLEPDKATHYLMNLLPHIVQHIELLGQDPILNVKAKEYMEAFKVLNQQANQVAQLAQQIMQQRQAEANQPQPLDPETQADIMRKDALAQSKEQRTNFLTASRTQQANDRIQVDKELGLARIEAQKEVDLYKAANQQ